MFEMFQDQMACYTHANIKGTCDVLWFAKTVISSKHRHKHQPQPAIISLCENDKLRLCGLSENMIFSLRGLLNQSGLTVKREDATSLRKIGKGYRILECR